MGTKKPMKIRVSDLVPGMVLYRELGKGTQIRRVLELWDGEDLHAELTRWGIYVPKYGSDSQNWSRVAYATPKGQVHRVTREGLARWAHGVITEDTMENRDA